MLKQKKVVKLIIMSSIFIIVCIAIYQLNNARLKEKSYQDSQVEEKVPKDNEKEEKEEFEEEPTNDEKEEIDLNEQADNTSPDLKDYQSSNQENTNISQNEPNINNSNNNQSEESHQSSDTTNNQNSSNQNSEMNNNSASSSQTIPQLNEQQENNNTQSEEKHECTPKKFIMSWVRADFSNFEDCKSMGDKYLGSYGYFCDNFVDDCGEKYYMLTLFDNQGNHFDYHDITIPNT